MNFVIFTIRQGGEKMSDYITADNLELIVEHNEKIKVEVSNELIFLMQQFNIREGVKSEAKLAFKILKQYGLLQVPIENKYWSGAIYQSNDKRIPVINTALPRMNQYFAAWHEVYHLIYGKNENAEVYEINVEPSKIERKADYFAAKALMGNVYNFYVELKNEKFLDKIAQCMDLYQVPYKAILIQLFEEAKLFGNKELMNVILDNFDLKDIDWSVRFEKLGLDKELVTPSYVINLEYLENKMREKMHDELEVSAHRYNLYYLEELQKKMKNLIYGGYQTDGRETRKM